MIDDDLKKMILDNVDDFITLGFQEIKITIKDCGFSIIPTKKIRISDGEGK